MNDGYNLFKEKTMNKMPPLGISTLAKIIRVIDGDTVEIEVTRKFSVRLTHPNDQGLQFNSPNVHTSGGIKAKKLLEDHLSTCGNQVLLFVPSNNPTNLMDFNSFNRIVGEIWLNGEPITNTLLESGLCSLVKKGECT